MSRLAALALGLAGTHPLVARGHEESFRNMTLNERVLKGSRQVFSRCAAIMNSDVLGQDVSPLILPKLVKKSSSIKLIATLTAGKAKASQSRGLRSP
jgi:hypothetical protein